MGTYLTGEVSVIHAEADVDFENYAYSAIFCNTGGAYTINGASVTMVAGRTLNIIVQESTTTLDGTNFLLMGNPIAPQTKVKTGLISGTTETFQNNTGWVETYQYVDIKTGNPIQS